MHHVPPKRWYPTATLHGVTTLEDLDLKHREKLLSSWEVGSFLSYGLGYLVD